MHSSLGARTSGVAGVASSGEGGGGSTIGVGVLTQGSVRSMISGGSRRWVTARGEVQRDADGRIIGLRGTVQDITERKQREQSLDLFRSLAGIPGLADRVEHTLGLVGLSARADTPVSALAYGEKRRLEIGLALATSPRLLLLDEPLAGMSPHERVETVRLLKSISQGRTMIFIGTDGHHQVSPGGYGREWLYANRDKFFSKTAVMFNA